MTQREIGGWAQGYSATLLIFALASSGACGGNSEEDDAPAAAGTSNVGGAGGRGATGGAGTGGSGPGGATGGAGRSNASGASAGGSSGMSAGGQSAAGTPGTGGSSGSVGMGGATAQSGEGGNSAGTGGAPESGGVGGRSESGGEGGVAGLAGSAGSGQGGAGGQTAVEYRSCEIPTGIARVSLFRIDRTLGTCTRLVFQEGVDGCALDLTSNGWCLAQATLSADVSACESLQNPSNPVLASGATGTFSISLVPSGLDADITLEFPQSANLPQTIRVQAMDCLADCLMNDCRP